jgi:hypothetical protein
MKIFLTAFFQVFLVSANTLFIARMYWPGIAAAGFGISYLWAINVRRVNVSTLRDRMIYATGAMLGGLSGVFVSSLIRPK